MSRLENSSTRVPDRPERSIKRSSQSRKKEFPPKRRSIKPIKESPSLPQKEEEIRSILQDYISDQKYLKEIGFFEEFGQERGGRLFEAYEMTDSYIRACSEAELAQKDPNIKNRLRGHMFADIAFHVMSARESGIVIPAEGVLEIAKILYPDTGVSKKPFDQTSLKGEYVPDGLVINEDGKITKMLEYKFSDDGDRIRSQEKRSRQFARDLRHFFDYDPLLTTVTPANGNKKREHMPFTAKEFDRHFKEVINTPDSAVVVFER